MQAKMPKKKSYNSSTCFFSYISRISRRASSQSLNHFCKIMNWNIQLQNITMDRRFCLLVLRCCGELRHRTSARRTTSVSKMHENGCGFQDTKREKTNKGQNQHIVPVIVSSLTSIESGHLPHRWKQCDQWKSLKDPTLPAFPTLRLS